MLMLVHTVELAENRKKNNCRYTEKQRKSLKSARVIVSIKYLVKSIYKS